MIALLTDAGNGGIFSLDSVKDMSAFAALLIIFGYQVWRQPKVHEKMLDTFRGEMAEERTRCDKQNEVRDQRIERLLTVIERQRDAS